MQPPYRVRPWVSVGALLIGLVVLPSTVGVATVAPERLDGRRASAAAAISLAVGGDVLLGEDVNTLIAREGPEAPLAGVPDLQDADMALVNLEGIVAPGADAVDTGVVGDFYFLGRPESLSAIVAAGIDVVVTANNHALDFGPESLAAQNSLLDQMRMAHPGTGATPTEACAPAVVAVGDIRVAVLSVDATTPGSASSEGRFGTCHLSTDPAGWPPAFRAAFAGARAQADVVLVVPQFRASFATEPDPDARRTARLLIDLGADAVLGMGAHAIQGIEVYGGRPILHNTGSLLFNFPEPDDAVLFLLDLDARGVTGIRTVPLITERAWTRPADPEEAKRILAAIDARSLAFGTSTAGGALDLSPPARVPPTSRPATLAELDPGPAPGPVLDAPPACRAEVLPEAARIEPIDVGPLTLVGARTESDRLDGPKLIWLETFWRVDARPASDLVIAPRATPRRGTPWQGVHEPCDWAWPTSRWEPGTVYRDRYPLRPPVDVQRLAGLPALISMTGYGRLDITVDVLEDGRILGTTGVLRAVVLDPRVATRIGIIALVLGTVALARALGRRWRRTHPRA